MIAHHGYVRAATTARGYVDDPGPAGPFAGSALMLLGAWSQRGGAFVYHLADRG